MSLIELMIVIAIMGFLMTMVGGNVMSKFRQAKIETTKNNMRSLGTILDEFKMACNFYPYSEQGLEALVKQPAPVNGRECKNYDPEGYIKDKKVPKDGWGNDYMYESDGSKYKLISLGNDGKVGGEGEDKDLSNEDL